MRKSTIRKQKKVISHIIANDGNVRAACASAKISKTQFYVWKNNDKQFGIDVDNAMNTHIEVAKQIHLMKVLESGNAEDSLKLLLKINSKIKKALPIHKVLNDNNLNHKKL